MNKKARAALIELAGEAFSGTDVYLAYAHGSRVSGKAMPWSDLDVGYYLHPKCGRCILQVREEMILSDRLSTGMNLEVDLRNLGEAPLEMRGRALEEGICIYSSDEQARVNLETYVLSRYHDAKETYRRMHETRFEHFAAPETK